MTALMYVCIDIRYVCDKIAHKLISASLYFSLYGSHRISNPISDHNKSN